MTDVESRVALFVEALSSSCRVSSPGLRFDAPISKDAQYSPVRQQIQYYDTAEMLQSLSENGGAAPVRWTLHEFAHHLIEEHDKQQSEEFARWFTDTFTGNLMGAWQAAVVEGERPSVSIDVAKVEERLDELADGDDI